MKRSFTVTELLVAIAIIVILTGILIGGLGYAGRRADEAKTIAAVQELSAALEAFRAEKGYYPPCRTSETVKFYRDSGVLKLYLGSGTLVYTFEDKQGKPFIDLSYITGTTRGTANPYADTWETALRYQCPGSHNKGAFDLYSFGPDKKSSTDDEKLDDIANWDNASQN